MLKDCREIKNLLPDFLSNRADVGEQKSVQEHIDRCVSCRQEALALKETFQALERSEASTPSVAYWTNFLPRLRERLGEVGGTKQESVPWVTKFLVPAAGLVVAVFLIARIEIVPGSKGALSEVRQLVEQMDTAEFQRLAEVSSDPLFPESSSRLEVSLSRDEEARRAINSLIATSGDEVIQLREVSLHGLAETGLEDLTDEEMEAVIHRLESRGTL
jgi:hypothetical protein